MIMNKIWEFLEKNVDNDTLTPSNTRRLAVLLKEYDDITASDFDTLFKRYPCTDCTHIHKIMYKLLADTITVNTNNTNDTNDYSDDEIIDLNDYSEDEDYDYNDDFTTLDNTFKLSRKRKRELGIDKLSRDEYKNITKKLANLRTKHEEDRLDMHRILLNDFNDDDNEWFYKMFTRLSKIDEINGFSMYDEIKRRYTKLVSLKNANLYGINDNKGTIIERISNSPYDRNVKSILVNKVLNVNTDMVDEYQKLMLWLNVVLKIPYNSPIKSYSDNMVIDLKNALDDKLFGIKKVKTLFLEAYMKTHSSSGSVIGLVGPPGIGKTSLAHLLASITGMGFGIVQCGSIKDKAVLTGHSSTYIGAEPGIITKIMIGNKTTRNVIVLDELCKMSPDLIPIFMGILDFTQNDKIVDDYCPEIPIDMSKNIYVVTMNSIDNIDNALLNRMELIHMSGYDYKEKFNIVKKHIVPGIKHKLNMTCDINDRAIESMIKTYSPDVSGVRLLKNLVDRCYRRIKLISVFVQKFNDININTKKTRSNRNKKYRHTVNIHEYIQNNLEIVIPNNVDLYNIHNIKSINTDLMLALTEE